MASTHFYFQQNSQHGIIQRNGMSGMESSLASLDHNFATQNTMLTGPSADDASYSEIVLRYGYENNAKAHEAYNELNAMMIQINTIRVTLVQAFNKFR